MFKYNKMEKFKYSVEKIINGFVYTTVTSINVIGNLTSPFYNMEIERKFNLDLNITDTGLTMDDFDSDYSSIIQDLSDIKYKLIGESGNDIISKFSSDTISNKIDDWLKTCNNFDHFADIKKDLSKIKITYDYLFCSNNNQQRIPVRKNGRNITNKNEIIEHCNKKIKILKKNMKLLLNDGSCQRYNFHNSIKNRINNSSSITCLIYIS